MQTSSLCMCLMELRAGKEINVIFNQQVVEDDEDECEEKN